MNIRQVEKDDLKQIHSWMKDKPWPLPSVDSIAPEFGLCAESGDTLLAAAFVYTTGRSIAFIEFTAINPDVQKQITLSAMSEILSQFKDMCHNSNPKIRALSLVTSHEPTARHLQKNGFKIKKGQYKCLWVSRATRSDE